MIKKLEIIVIGIIIPLIIFYFSKPSELYNILPLLSVLSILTILKDSITDFKIFIAMIPICLTAYYFPIFAVFLLFFMIIIVVIKNIQN